MCAELVNSFYISDVMYMHAHITTSIFGDRKIKMLKKLIISIISELLLLAKL